MASPVDVTVPTAVLSVVAVPREKPLKFSVVTPATADVWTPAAEMVVVKAADAVDGASHKQTAVSVRMLTLRKKWAFTF